MVEVKVQIKNEEGLHARPAGLFVKRATAFSSKIEVAVGDQVKNGKSIMSILSLGIEKGTEMRILATGSDEELAANTLAEFVKAGMIA